MKLIAPLLFLHLSQAYVGLNDCAIDQRSMKNVWENRLEDKLFCNYHWSIPPKPLNNSNAIDVTPHFVVKSFSYLSEEEIFSAFTWTQLSWTDERLQWDANEYDGIDDTWKDGSTLWLPGIKLYNSITDMYDQSYDAFMPCRIDSSGHVECMSLITFQAKCSADLNNWPFDTQVCTFEFGPWLSQGSKVRFKVLPVSVLFMGSEYGAEWDIIDYTQEENGKAEIQLKLYFKLIRHAEILAAIVIYPCILLSVLTLCTLFLNVRYDRRVYVACFSLMCHLYFLSELGMNIPKHSKRSPKILLYYRGSIIMSFISIVLTLLMKFLYKREVPVPNIIAVVNANVYKSHVKLVIRPRWDAVTEDDDKRELAKAWADFVSILNCLWVYVSLIVYIVMCCVYIPLPSGLEQNIISHTYYVYE